MVARVNTVAFQGIEVLAIDVQVQVAAGLPAFAVVGLPDKAVAESRERVGLPCRRKCSRSDKYINFMSFIFSMDRPDLPAKNAAICAALRDLNPINDNGSKSPIESCASQSGSDI